MNKNEISLVLTAGILAGTTGVATDFIRIPEVAHSRLVVVVLVLISLATFVHYPAVGMALFLFTVVVFFKRNVYTLLSLQSTYGEKSIPNQSNAHARAYTSDKSGPRDYSEFNETNAQNPMLGQEGFEPAPYGDEEGAPVDGQYPIQDERAMANSAEERDYSYRPASDTGSNDYAPPAGPGIEDEKLKAVAY